jgi:beta-glucosidase
MTVRAFPDGFIWAAATAGHQVEGDNTNSDTWFAENVEPSVFMQKSGRGCDSYARWAEDLDLATDLGLNAYRFSVEWARIEPEEGLFDEDELDHYEAIVDRCRGLGLAPIVTFNHFTSPHWFAARGSWLDPEAPALFARYCRVVAERFGDRIALAVTMNEPNLARLLTWIHLPDFVRDLERVTLERCGQEAGVPRYRLSNVMLPEEMDAMADGMEAGHRAGKAAIKAACPELPVGLSIAIIDDRVVGDDPMVRDRKRAEVYERWLRLARDDDFVGVQNYEAIPYDANGEVPPAEGVPVNGMGSAIDPTSLAGAVRYAYEMTGVPVLVTEHGLSHDDDALRVEFIPPAIAGLLDVIEDGVPVIGYTHWSLLDNFEWIFGYTKFYGLHTVDRDTFARAAKPSAAVYASIVRTNAV